jgi:phosphoesterase RecJ-like protein
MMVLDTSAWAQLGPMGDVLRGTTATKVVLDHHVSSDDLDAEVFRDVEAEATGRLVVEAAEHLDVRLTPEMATVLYAAQATDTGWYRYSSVTGEALRIAAKLVDAGAVPQTVYTELHEQDTLPRL